MYKCTSGTESKKSGNSVRSNGKWQLRIAIIIISTECVLCVLWSVATEAEQCALWLRYRSSFDVYFYSRPQFTHVLLQLETRWDDPISAKKIYLFSLYFCAFPFRFTAISGINYRKHCKKCRGQIREKEVQHANITLVSEDAIQETVNWIICCLCATSAFNQHASSISLAWPLSLRTRVVAFSTHICLK